MSALGKLFKKEPTPREVARSSQRDINRNSRDIEREIASLKREEQKLVKEIKAAANQGNQQGTRILAQQLVRLRGQITKMYTHQAQLKGVGLSVTTAASTATVGASMATAGKAMAQMGVAADAKKMQQQVMAFSRENAKMEMTGEMMDGALEDALDFEGLEDETEGVMAQVLDEIGVDLTSGLVSAPKQRVAAGQRQQQAEQEDKEADELAMRLAALK